MTDPTGPELSAWLARKVCKWINVSGEWCEEKRDGSFMIVRSRFAPHSDASDLREVLAKVPEEKQGAIVSAVVQDVRVTADFHPIRWFLLTAPPETVCLAIYHAMTKQE